MWDPVLFFPWELPRWPASSPRAGSLPFPGAFIFLIQFTVQNDFYLLHLSWICFLCAMTSLANREHGSVVRDGESRTTRTGCNWELSTLQQRRMFKACGCLIEAWGSSLDNTEWRFGSPVLNSNWGESVRKSPEFPNTGDLFWLESKGEIAVGLCMAFLQMCYLLLQFAPSDVVVVLLKAS